MRWAGFLLAGFLFFTIPVLMGQNQGNVCIQNSQGGSLFGACGRQDNCPTPPPITPTPIPTPTATPTPSPCASDSVCITVTDIPPTDTCISELRAVVFQDFDSRHSAAGNANDIALSTCNPDGSGNLTCEGQVNVGAGATNQTVYVYCDTSTDNDAYDRDGNFGTPEPQAYTNLQQLNICPRELTLTSGGTSAYYRLYNTTASLYTNTTLPTPPTPPAPPFGGVRSTFISKVPTTGDRFNAAMEDAGGQISFTLSDLQSLPDSGNHPVGGNLQTWCNCILGTDVRYNIITNVTYSLAFQTGLGNYRGFFTDTDPGTSGTPANCILP